MKILYLCFDPGIDLSGVKGASIHVRSFVKGLTELGHGVAVVGTKVSSPEAFETITGATVFPAPFTPRMRDLLRALKTGDGFLAGGPTRVRNVVRALHNTEFFKLANKCAGQFSPSFIYERYSLWGMAGLRLARKYSVPVVLEVNSPLTCEEEKYRGGFAFPPLARWAERRIWRRADLLVAVSQGLRSHFEEAGVKARNVEVLPNAVDTSLFRLAVDDVPLRTQLKPDSRFVIGFVGSFKGWHGVDFLLQAFAKLRAEDASCHLLLVGDGPMRAQLEEAVRQLELREAVTLAGNIPHEDVPRYLALMDVAVAPYPVLEDFYFSPLKLYEYMAGSRAVVASKVGQVAEVITDGVTGLLYEPGNQEGFIGCIRRLRADESLRKELGKNARMACSKNTWKGNAERVIGWVEPMLQHAAGQSFPRTRLANGTLNS